nr:MAG TPA: hypothetical protein [Caudoviricetes sp.]
MQARTEHNQSELNERESHAGIDNTRESRNHKGCGILFQWSECGDLNSRRKPQVR